MANAVRTACCKDIQAALKKCLVGEDLGGLYTLENLQALVCQGSKPKSLMESFVSFFSFQTPTPDAGASKYITCACPAEAAALIDCRTEQCPTEAARAAIICQSYVDNHWSDKKRDACAKHLQVWQQCRANFST